MVPPSPSTLPNAIVGDPRIGEGRETSAAKQRPVDCISPVTENTTIETLLQDAHFPARHDIRTTRLLSFSY
jgi:hypothetical protein